MIYVHEPRQVFVRAKLKRHVTEPARLGEVSEGWSPKEDGQGLRYRVRRETLRM